MKWKEGRIDGVVVKPLAVNKDKRGRLVEVWRADWCAECRGEKVNYVSIPCACGKTHAEGWRCKDCGAVVDLRGEHNPAMAYLSNTAKYVTRGPHEHIEQTDVFCFLSRFAVRLWDSRKGSETKGKRMTLIVRAPVVVVVPPGIVHAYMSLDDDGLVLNLPDKLYAGVGKTEKVDEIRHENKKRSPYKMDDWNDPLRLSGRLVPVPTSFTLGSQVEVNRNRKNIGRLLKLLGHSEALVTDESTIGDFLPDGDGAKNVRRFLRVGREVGFPIRPQDLLVQVASRMKSKNKG